MSKNQSNGELGLEDNVLSKEVAALLQIMYRHIQKTDNFNLWAYFLLLLFVQVYEATM